MEVFELIVDKKVAVWKRKKVKIKAESLDSAIDFLLRDNINIGEVSVVEYLNNTEEHLEPGYDHPMTLEVMDTSYKVLKTNEIY